MRSEEKNGGVGMEQVKEGVWLEKEKSGERREEENQVKNNDRLVDRAATLRTNTCTD